MSTEPVWTEEMRIQLLEGAHSLDLELDSQAVQRFELYLQELLTWNQKQNLTAIREPGDIISRHFLDALTCAAAYDFSAARPVIDVGTGAGFPGLPLKIAFPFLSLSLLDSSIKKVEFLKHLCPLLGFNDVDVVHGRAEEFGHVGSYRQRFHMAVSRGLAPLPVLAELCLPFVSVGGYFIAQKGLDIASEIEAAAQAIPALGGGQPEVIEVSIPGADLHHALVRIRKQNPTLSQYPRRPGVPGRRPLGSLPAGKQKRHPKYR